MPAGIPIAPGVPMPAGVTMPAGMPPMAPGMPPMAPGMPPIAPGIPMPAGVPMAPGVPMPTDKAHSLLSSMASDRKLAINPIQVAQRGGAFIGDDAGISGTVFLTVLYGGLLLAIGNFMYKQYKKVKEDRKQLEKPKEEHDDIPPSIPE
jgi:hypothetical protein